MIATVIKKSVSPETKRKISESMKGKYIGDKHPMFGKHHSLESKRKMSDAKKGKYIGEKHAMYGRHHSVESRRKISESKKGSHHTPQTLQKMADSHKGDKNPFFGKCLSEEHKKRLSENHADFSGEKHPFFGKHHSEETKQAISKINWKGGTKLSNGRSCAKRKEFGFVPLNEPEEDGYIAHHLDREYVFFIPEELHKSVYHSVTKDINMDTINNKVFDWAKGE